MREEVGSSGSGQQLPRKLLAAPLLKATALARGTMELFPLRVWQHFLRHNGLVLAAGVSYQGLFASFAAIYLAFATAGLWFGAGQRAVDGLIDLVNGYLPGFISEEGAISADQVTEIVLHSAGLLSWTGAIALVLLAWTAVGAITFTRKAVQDIFDLPFDSRGYIRVKGIDIIAAAVFGGVLILGGILGSAAGGTLDALITRIGGDTLLANLLLRGVSVLLGLAINVATIAGLVRFLTTTSLPWRTIIPGAAAGGIALSVLQLGAGFLLSSTPNNPLLATFAFLIGLLLWFRLNGIVILVSAAWIAVDAGDHSVELQPLNAAERARAERKALILAAEVRVREAQSQFDGARWPHRWFAKRQLKSAEEDLVRLLSDSPDNDARHSIQ